jgi:hypothetical protein
MSKNGTAANRVTALQRAVDELRCYVILLARGCAFSVHSWTDVHTGGRVMARELETSDYYRARAKALRALADDETNPETAITLQHIASNFDVIAGLIDMMNGVKPWPS